MSIWQLSLPGVGLEGLVLSKLKYEEVNLCWGKGQLLSCGCDNLAISSYHHSNLIPLVIPEWNYVAVIPHSYLSAIIPHPGPAIIPPTRQIPNITSSLVLTKSHLHHKYHLSRGALILHLILQYLWYYISYYNTSDITSYITIPLILHLILQYLWY